MIPLHDHHPGKRLTPDKAMALAIKIRKAGVPGARVVVVGSRHGVQLVGPTGTQFTVFDEDDWQLLLPQVL